ncbi:cytochrome c [Pseudorhodobacter sp. W20_MBD10_FR17]|uniref:c-type cytochrome n=1 Tax=Pseudorhodobacter sp. W20_MBD10_FR17 TaxID=3240266 RepID=UPI003F94356E
MESRLGGTGPALIPESLGRLKGESLEAIIAGGRVATQMPAFKDTLIAQDIAAVASFITTLLETPPTWTVADIESTRSLDA